ncbi:MAG: hypothetical protein WC824_00750, partial [Bacteroidota bacterium]
MNHLIPELHLKQMVRIVFLITLIIGMIIPLKAQQGNVSVTITSDNAYEFGFGDVNGIPVGSLYGGVTSLDALEIYGSAIWDVNAHGGALPPAGQTPFYGPEKYTVNESLTGKYLYIVAWSDNAQYQGTIATFEDAQTQVRYATGPNSAWEVYATGVDYDSETGLFPSRDDVNSQITTANGKTGLAPGSIGWVNATGCSDGSGGCRGSLLYCQTFTDTWFNLNPDLQQIFGDAVFMWYRNPDYANGDCNQAVTPAALSGEYLIFRLGPLDQVIPQPCDSLGAKVLYDPDRPCCAKILLSNAAQHFWEKIQIKVLSGNATIADIPHSNEWTVIQGNAPVMDALLFPNSGSIPICTDQEFFSICLEGAEQISGTVEITWISRDSVLCRDTLVLQCTNVIDPCDDPKCETNILNINTGVGTNPGGLEPHWELTGVPPNSASTTVPRSPYVIDNHQAWFPYTGTTSGQWISANQNANWSPNNKIDPYVFEYCLCVCRDDQVRLDMKYWVDNSAVVKLNGVPISATGTLNSTDNFQTGTTFSYPFS